MKSDKQQSCRADAAPWWERFPPVLHGPDSGQRIAELIRKKGSSQDARRNMTASLWLMRLDLWPGLSQPIHGDVLIMGGTDEDGETMSVTEDIVASIPIFWREPHFEIITGPEALG